MINHSQHQNNCGNAIHIKQNVSFMQIAEQTDEEKLSMYMKSTKKELALMLIQCNKIIDIYVKPSIHTVYET